MVRSDTYKLANTYPDAKLVLIHWGTMDSPNDKVFNDNPQNIFDHVVNPDRVIVLAPGSNTKFVKRETSKFIKFIQTGIEINPN